MFYDKPDLINTRADEHRQGHGGGRAARREAVPGEDRTHGGRHHSEGRGAAEGRPVMADATSRRRVGAVLAALSSRPWRSLLVAQAAGAGAASRRRPPAW